MVFALTFLGALAAAAYLVVAPKAYTATASVYVTSNAANTAQLLGNKTNTVINMDNELQIVMSTSVSRLAVARLHSDLTPAALSKKVSVVIPVNTQILQISCSDRSPTGAAACAQAFATSYLQARETTARAKIQSQIQVEQGKEKALLAKAIKLQTQLASLKAGSAAASAAHQAFVNISTQLAPLRAVIASLDASTNYKAGYIITAALRPTTPSSPRKLLYGPSGVMVGLLVGLLGAFWADRRDDRIHAATDVERFLDIPVLFSLVHPAAGMASTVVPARTSAGQAFTELARATAAALGDGSHVLLVVGASAGSGTGLVAANVAAALGRIRSEVVLVCADQHGSISPQLLRVGPGDGQGLAELIAGTAAISDVARPAPAAGRLRVIGPGADLGPLDDLQYDAGRRAVMALKEGARYVVIDAGAISVGSALGLAEFADAAIVVAELDITTRADVADCIRRLDRIRTEVLGAAVLPQSRWSAKAAKAARQAVAASATARGAKSERAGSRSGDGKRREGAAMPPSGERTAAAEPYGPGTILSDFGRRAKHGMPGEGTVPTEPRAGHTWPLPKITGSDRDEPPGPGLKAGYPVDYPASAGPGDS
jgi:capsular polysaccharide biosynthesis protein/Mrp family chromosome partitioning ATPase